MDIFSDSRDSLSYDPHEKSLLVSFSYDWNHIIFPLCDITARYV